MRFSKLLVSFFSFILVLCFLCSYQIRCLEIEDKPLVKVTDEQAQKIIQRYSKCKNVAEFQALDVKVRDKYLKKLKENGLSIRQICRLTGVSFGTVRKF